MYVNMLTIKKEIAQTSKKVRKHANKQPRKRTNM